MEASGPCRLQKIAIEKAKAGEGVRPSERRRLAQEKEMETQIGGYPIQAPGGRGYPPADGFSGNSYSSTPGMPLMKGEPQILFLSGP